MTCGRSHHRRFTGSASARAGSVLKRKLARSNEGFTFSMDTIPGNDGRASKNLITSNELPSSVSAVVSSDDLLTEILLRLPILSLLFFKSVSKHWLSLIRHINSTSRRTQNPHLDPPTGLFVRRFIVPKPIQP
ncbi:F-box protein-like protein isoform X2, partial [Tanacetum coccineum]